MIIQTAFLAALTLLSLQNPDQPADDDRTAVIEAVPTSQDEPPGQPVPAEPQAAEAENPPVVGKVDPIQESPPAKAKRWWEWSKMTGDWGGARKQLEDQGIKLDLSIQSFMANNAKGGKDTKDALEFSGSVDADFRLDFEKLGLIPGGEFITRGKSVFGNVVNPQVGALYDPYDDADGYEATFTNKVYWQQTLFEKRVQLRFGYLDFQDHVDKNVYANSEDKQFFNTALDNNPLIPLPTAQGAFLLVNPTDWVGFTLGVGDAESERFHDGFDTMYHDDARLYGYLENQWKITLPSKQGPLAGNYRFGMIYDPNPKNIFDASRADLGFDPHVETKDYGFYMSHDQKVLRESEADDQGLGVFFRYGLRHGTVNRVEHFWSTGMEYLGLLPERDKDVFGFGFYQGEGSEEQRREVNADFEREFAYEMYYSILVTPWLALTPDFQYVVDPGGDTDADDAIIVGLRARFVF